jgi:hypothetical protein
VNGLPSWNVTPVRNRNVQLSWSGDTVHDSARAGFISRLASGSTRVSNTFSSTSNEKYALVFCGSSWSGSPAMAAMRLPEP